ncbi:MAG: hypothetical protein JO250_01920 [Armatimonadetes bacterium]|nr:hypothetical protein [Armatimonadota bacterium]
MHEEVPILPDAHTRKSPPAFKRLPQGQPLPDYGVEYFNQLVAQYQTLTPEEKKPNPSAQELADLLILEQDRHRLNWGDLSGLEMCLLKLAPGAALPYLACSLRARYQDVAGHDWYDQNGLMAPPERAVTLDDAMRANLLRADLEMLLADMQRIRGLITARERQRNQVTVLGTVAAAAALLAALALGHFSRYHAAAAWRPLMVVGFVMLTGATGGLVSMLRRLQCLSTTCTPVHDTIQFDAGQPSLWLSALYGAIFAKILTLVFMGHMLNTLIGVPDAGTTSLFPNFLSGFQPAGPGEFAKLMVWSFIAGFAEKFVPDVLDRITKNQEGRDRTVVRRRVDSATPAASFQFAPAPPTAPATPVADGAAASADV